MPEDLLHPKDPMMNQFSASQGIVEPAEKGRSSEQLISHTEVVAQEYGFEPKGHRDAELFPEFNKYFLAMLNDYVKSSGYEFPHRNEVNVLDFGCGMMLYYDGYKTFFEKYGAPNNEKRDVGIIAWEGDPVNPICWGEGMLAEVNIFVEPETKKSTLEWIEKALTKREHRELDVITLFGMGPSADITDPKEVDESYRQAIPILAESLSDNGLVIATTSFGGAKLKPVLEGFHTAGLEVLAVRPNEYQEVMYDSGSSFTHEEILIAVKKSAESVE